MLIAALCHDKDKILCLSDPLSKYHGFLCSPYGLLKLFDAGTYFAVLQIQIGIRHLAHFFLIFATLDY